MPSAGKGVGRRLRMRRECWRGMFVMAGKVRIAVTGGPIKGSGFVYCEHDTLLFGRAPDCHARLSEEDRSPMSPRRDGQLEGKAELPIT